MNLSNPFFFSICWYHLLLQFQLVPNSRNLLLAAERNTSPLLDWSSTYGIEHLLNLMSSVLPLSTTSWFSKPASNSPPSPLLYQLENSSLFTLMQSHCHSRFTFFLFLLSSFLKSTIFFSRSGGKTLTQNSSCGTLRLHKEAKVVLFSILFLMILIFWLSLHTKLRISENFQWFHDLPNRYCHCCA